MVIRLEADEYLEALPDLEGRPDFLNFVRALGELLHRRLHLVSARRGLLLRWSTWTGLSDPQREALAHMDRSLTTSPAKQASVGLVLTGPVALADPGRKVPPPATTGWRRRPWTWLAGQPELRRMVLGAENDDDGAWYRWLGESWACKAQRLPPLRPPELSLRPEGWGGSTAAQRLASFLRRDEPVLVVLDSDQDCPTGPMGDTAAGARRELQEASQTQHATSALEPLAWLEVLRARSLENTLPAELLRRIQPTTTWVEPMIRRGFFAQPALDLRLAYIPLGKAECAARLAPEPPPNPDRHGKHAYRRAALARMGELDSDAPRAPRCERGLGEGRPCEGKRSDGRPAPPDPACEVVCAIGKPLKGLAAWIDDAAQVQEKLGDQDAPSWLARQLTLPNSDPPSFDPVLEGLAHQIWSLGLCPPPSIRAAE